MLKTLKKHDALAAFLLNLAAALLVFCWYIFLNCGRFSICGDFNAQQIPFAMHANRAIKSGQTVWDWSIDLGTNFISGLSFYVLGNPSFWISLLFPAADFMYVVGWIQILKYALAGLTSHLWMRRFVKAPACSVMASMMYAFSGFSATNLLFYHFHDVVWLFPLLLISFDDLVQKGRRARLFSPWP